MRRTTVILAILVAGLVCIWIGYKELATGLVLMAGLLVKLLEHQNAPTIQEVEHESVGYPLLVLSAMDWKKSGRDYFIPEGEDKANPHLLYVGITTKGSIDGKPLFLPELEVTAHTIDQVRYLD